MLKDEMELDLKPDFKAIFHMFSEEARSQFNSLLRDSPLADLRDIQRFMAPLNIAMQSLTSVEEVNILRSVVADMVKNLCEKADALDDK